MTDQNFLLNIENITASINNNIILKNLSLSIKEEGEIHILMGPNGSGKSTLSKLIVGHPLYELEEGNILYKDYTNNIINLTDLEIHERALNGIFLGFQHPIEISGITNIDFLREIYNQNLLVQQNKNTLTPIEFEAMVKPLLQQVNLQPEFLYRSINEGFSGGEKKRNELLQLLLLKPKLIILDEIDSGLDIDSMELTSKLVSTLLDTNSSLILISHYTNFIRGFLKLGKKFFIHVLQKGSIVKSGDETLLNQIEAQGFNSI